MKALIIGAAGFVGKYLITHFESLGWEVHATRLVHETIETTVPVYVLDILDQSAISALLEKTAPDYVFHLAAQSSVALSWKEPAMTVDINIKGAVHLLEAARLAKKPPRVLLVGSAEEYGPVNPAKIPIKEDEPLRPGNVYAVTKAAQGMIGRLYAEAYGLDIVMTRSFNHIGPGQSEAFVSSGFCKQTAEIEAGLRPPLIRTGNLSAKRDFTDVRDVVRAYALLAQKGNRGETYNVGTGRALSIKEILDKIVAFSSAKISVETDSSLLRSSDTPEETADISRLRELTGWKPEIPLDKTLSDMLDNWRAQVRR